MLKPTKQQEYGNSTYGNIADAVGGHLVQSETYDPAFVAKIRRAEKSRKHVVDTDKIWD